MFFSSFKRFVVLGCICLGFFFARPAAAYVSPGAPQGYVNDFAHVLTPAQHDWLETTVQNYEQQTTNQIAIVTIPSLGGDTVENYASQLFQEWGIGQKNKDNGVLLLIALQDRKLRIEVGYGLEGDLTDAESASLIRDATPFFREQQYYEAIYKLTTGIQAEIEGTTSVAADLSAATPIDQWFNGAFAQFPKLSGIGFFLSIVLLMFVLRFLLGLVLGTIGFLFSWLFALITGGPRPSFRTSVLGNGRGFRGIAGGFFGGGFGRGGGFGGGRSGGGGASGGW